MIDILMDRWRAHRLAWIHRAEARTIAAELRTAGNAIGMLTWDERAIEALYARRVGCTLLLRLSDPLMLQAVHALSGAGIAYCGPGVRALARCYDKAHAYELAGANGIDHPLTRPATEAETLPRPLVLKPRRGSDSIGLRLLRAGPIPAACRTPAYLAQPFIRGMELTVAVAAGEAGLPLRIELPDGAPYTFWRKYLRPPRKSVLAHPALTERVRAEALRIARLCGTDWAARVDFIYERATDRLVFLECDAAPLVGPASAFAASLGAAGMTREAQLRRLLASPASFAAAP